MLIPDIVRSQILHRSLDQGHICLPLCHKAVYRYVLGTNAAACLEHVAVESILERHLCERRRRATASTTQTPLEPPEAGRLSQPLLSSSSASLRGSTARSSATERPPAFPPLATLARRAVWGGAFVFSFVFVAALVTTILWDDHRGRIRNVVGNLLLAIFDAAAAVAGVGTRSPRP